MHYSLNHRLFVYALFSKPCPNLIWTLMAPHTLDAWHIMMLATHAPVIEALRTYLGPCSWTAWISTTTANSKPDLGSDRYFLSLKDRTWRPCRLYDVPTVRLSMVSCQSVKWAVPVSSDMARSCLKKSGLTSIFSPDFPTFADTVTMSKSSTSHSSFSAMVSIDAWTGWILRGDKDTVVLLFTTSIASEYWDVCIVQLSSWISSGSCLESSSHCEDSNPFNVFEAVLSS